MRVAPCAPGPSGCAAHGVEGVACVSQRSARFGNTTLASQPLAMRQQEPSLLEGPVREVGAERFIEAVGSFLVVLGEEGARVQVPEMSPATASTCRTRARAGSMRPVCTAASSMPRTGHLSFRSCRRGACLSSPREPAAQPRR
jgi:hypothetical protein